MYRIMRRRADVGLSTDIDALKAAGLYHLAYWCVEEWWAYPLGIRELEARLRERWLRQRLDVIGEALVAVARDPASSPEALREAVRDATGRLRAMGGGGG